MTAVAKPTYALFETAIGLCAVVWTSAGIREVRLPERTPERTQQLVAQTFGSSAEAVPPVSVQAAIDGMVALLAGSPADFDGVQFDPIGVPEFNESVYRVTRAIPAGTTLSYGQVAAKLGSPGAARAVGRALGDNPCPIITPCHRVVAADGAMHGFSAPGGIVTKRRILQIEGALPPDEPTLF